MSTRGRPEKILRPTLAEEIRGCGSPEAILTVLKAKANELNQSLSSDERLTKWLTPTVNVLNALSATLGQGAGMVNCILTLTSRSFPLPKSSFLE